MILRTLAIFVLAAAVLIAAVLVFAATKPNTFRIQRTLTINATPGKVFLLIDDFHNWSRWAPQDREDSTMRRTFSGPASGLGAGSAWDSSGSAGKGTMIITESATPAKVVVQVDWKKPFATRNMNEFALEPEGAVTRVTWSMQGKYLYMMKVTGVFVNLDKMMGKHFESGLANLKAAAEQ